MATSPGGAPTSPSNFQASGDAAWPALQLARADERTEALADFGHQVIEAGQKLSLSANYTMIKELEDTEVFRSLQICRSLSLTVVDKTSLNLHIQAKSMHPGRLEMIGSAGSTMRWRLADIILPQQGTMVFWKRHRAPAGAGQS